MLAPEQKIKEVIEQVWDCAPGERAVKTQFSDHPTTTTTNRNFSRKRKDENIKDLMQSDIKSYSLSETKVTSPMKDTAILTYRLDGVSIASGKVQKDPLYCPPSRRS